LIEVKKSLPLCPGLQLRLKKEGALAIAVFAQSRDFSSSRKHWIASAIVTLVRASGLCGLAASSRSRAVSSAFFPITSIGCLANSCPHRAFLVSISGSGSADNR